MNIIPWTRCLLIAVLLIQPDYICCAGLGSTCTLAAQCSGVTNATCKSLTCKCEALFKTDKQTCVLNGINDTCAGNQNCLSANHLTCDTLKCQCAQGYKPKAGACIPKVIGKQCTDATVSTDCPLENSVCTSSKCACKSGYNNNADRCLKIIGGHCMGSSACTGDTHSVCNNNLCECAEHFGEKDNVCTATLDSKQCTPPKGTECGANAECDEKTKACRCSSGFKMNVDTCVADNGGMTTSLTFAILAIPGLLALREAYGQFM
ncbi:cell death abnormality protein 1-like [Ruditapes philippinarum]|uniref:cell death abnormality protein 1-like n=1 Tax=Ruditapes philippinarum TaxID=129788 RepID=UPI00295A899A|nr:cell death abnormality protein 1-like [Ruditapes philippinarum]XP_060586323.1 cell death abnormality protein 1-like [Ruditapes philippinarum]